MTRHRPHFVAGLLLAIAVSVCFWRWTTHPADVLVGPQRNGQNDLTSNVLAFRGSLSGLLSEGSQAILWNPSSLAGVPWLGNPQAAMFYPPNWIYAFVDSRLAVSWLMVGHHWLAGLGTCLLCRRYGLAWSAAVFAGMAFMAAPYYVAQTGEGHYNQVCLIAWIPWAFLGVERLRAGQRGGVVGTALVLTAAFFCGHVQELFYLVLLLTGYLAVDVFRGLRRRTRPKTETGTAPDRAAACEPAQAVTEPVLLSREAAGTAEGLPAMRIIVCWLAVGLAVAGLSAIELLPNWMYSRQSVRMGGLTLEHIRPMCLQPLSLLQMLDPFVAGGPADYRGPGEFYWETVCCFGVVPLVFAVAGVCCGFRRYPVGRFGALWLAAMLFAFGDRTPWFPLLYHGVPGVSLFRAPARALFFCSFFTAVLAGVGFDSFLTLAEASQIRCRRSLAAVAGLALVMAAGLWFWQAGGQAGGGAAAAGGPTGSWSDALRVLHAPRVLLWTLGGLGALWLLTLRGRWRTGAIAFGLAICGGELAWHAGHVLQTVPQEFIRRENPIVATIQTELGLQRVLAAQRLISDREAWQAGIQKVQGYEPVPLARFAIYAAAVAPGQDAALGFKDLDMGAARKPLLDLLGVRYAVLEGQLRHEVPGWKLRRTGQLAEEFTPRGSQVQYRPYAIYENVSPLPRAFVIGSATALSRMRDGIAALSRLDPRQQVLVERDILPAGHLQAFQSARIVGYAPAQVTIEAELNAPGYLVLTDTYYPGWTATVDGRPAPVVPANILFRAVALPPGRHVVQFQYATPGAKAGAFTTLMTLLLILMAVRNNRQRRAVPEAAKERFS
ncbi:MAG: YfhO family protein [Candidatus Anammoximicrobium sp.]|nr:YfhO family protein [Candidatus Anammoximicrobium sp.]